MMKPSTRVLRNTCVAVFLSALSGLAVASTASELTPKHYQLVDEQGVDVGERGLSGGHSISIGDASNGGLTYSANYSSGSNWTHYHSVIGFVRYDVLEDSETGNSTWKWSIHFQGKTEALDYAGGSSYVSDMGTHFTYTTSGGFINGATATLSDGTVLVFNPTPIFASYSGTVMRLTSATRPDGLRTDYHYIYTNDLALRAITNNRGYQMRFYLNNPNAAGLSPPSSVVLFNMAVDPCDPATATCPAFTRTWPRLTFEYSGNVSAVTETGGARTAYTYGSASQKIEFIDGPGTKDVTITYQNCGFDYPNGTCLAGGVLEREGGYRVSTVTKGGRTWTYTWDPSLTTTPGSAHGVRVTTTEGHVGYHTSAPHPYAGQPWDETTLPAPRLLGIKDALGRLTKIEQIGLLNPQLYKVTYPEGNGLQYGYDIRANVTSVTRFGKPGSGLANTVTTIVRGESGSNLICVQPAYCNKPILIKDPRGYVQRMTWDPVTGVLLADERGLQGPDNNLACSFGTNLCPKTELGYSWLSAYFFNASGQMAAGTPIFTQTSSSQCEAIANCGAGAAVVTSFGHGATGVANNLLLRTESVGKGGVARTTTYAYDPVGNRTEVDGPRTGVSDITRYAYDLDRRATDTVFADASATRLTYSPEGYIASFARGTSTGIPQFTAVETTANIYDGGGNLIKVTSPSGITQKSYDGAARPTCTATRMNPAVYGSLPTDACTLSAAGSNGPDRVVRNLYNAAGELTTIVRAYGTSLQQNYATFAYTLNGKHDWVQDANGNRSDYIYDGFDRLSRLNFPSTTIGANAANASDYELYGYDANDNRITLRLRSGETITYVPDSLNRESERDLPGSSASDVYRGYDLLSRQSWIRFQGVGGQGVDYTYDAWGGVLSEIVSGRTLSYLYDEAGNRKRITWPDSNYVDYTFDAMNRVDQVRENGATSGAGLLADYAYDALGRRSSLSYGNGAVASWAYDGASRLTDLTHNLANSYHDLTLGFSYNNASQVLSKSQSNDIYRYVPNQSVAQPYVPDGLNRYTPAGGLPYTYDARQNMTNDGTRAFTYDLENHLVRVDAAAGAPVQLTLTYDPRGRLLQTAGATTTQFLYAGDQLVAEFDGSGVLQRRYVPGSGANEVLVWYEGAGLSSSTRQWLHANNQGSVVGASGSTGALVDAPYSYSAFGEPDSAHGWTGSRFRFTGQIALPDVQLYHYRARVYDPVIGRFLQTDPIGYEDDFNLYAYVGNDPLNLTDPTGTQGIPHGTPRSCQSGCPPLGAEMLRDEVLKPMAAGAEQAMDDAVETGKEVASDVADSVSLKAQMKASMVVGVEASVAVDRQTVQDSSVNLSGKVGQTGEFALTAGAAAQVRLGPADIGEITAGTSIKVGIGIELVIGSKGININLSAGPQIGVSLKGLPKSPNATVGGSTRYNVGQHFQ